MLKKIGYFVCSLIAFWIVPVIYGQNDHLENAGALAGGLYGSGGKNGTAGGYIAVYDTGSIRRVANSGFMLDLGLIGPVPRNPVDGVFSVNYLTTYNTRSGPYAYSQRQIFPFATVGYSRLFATGNALNYGGGILLRYSKRGTSDNVPGVRFEYRDYWLPGFEHMRGFRISFEAAATEF